MEKGGDILAQKSAFLKQTFGLQHSTHLSGISMAVS